jgi:hypothetical protein
MGDSLVFDSSTPGGYTFELHSTNAQTLAAIGSNNWDYVVLQEQSQKPSFPPSQVATEVVPFATTLDSIIHANDSCTTTLFYMTWGRKNGDQANCAFYPPLCTYEGMQQRLRESYLLMGQMLDAEVAPVGAAWQQVRINNPGIELYQADESHPSTEGSYLAACVFYASIFHKSPIGAFHPATISATDAAVLQLHANTTVFDSIQNWLIDTTYVAADFNLNTINEPTIEFLNSSENADHYFWDFGDGSYSYETNPSHTFIQTGNFEVVLHAYKNCQSDTSTTYVSITLSAFNEKSAPEQQITIFPNPTTGNIYVDIEGQSFEAPARYELSSLQNGVVRNGILRSSKTGLDTENLQPGVYFIRVWTDDFQIIKKIVRL